MQGKLENVDLVQLTPCVIARAGTIAEHMVTRTVVDANRSSYPQLRSHFEGVVAVITHFEVDLDCWLGSITFPQRGECLLLAVKRQRVFFAHALPPFVDNTGRLWVSTVHLLLCVFSPLCIIVLGIEQKR